MIRIGSRGSALARWQADFIATQLRQRGYQVSIEILVTTGDRVQNAPFLQVGTKGMFTKEIEGALAENRIDLAVHSLKDLPTQLDSMFVLVAIPQRADARDALVSTRFEKFDALPRGAIVGTGSLRRQAQLRHLRPDLDVRELRGNVDTRLRKLEEGNYDAIVLASAGLDRLLQTRWIRERFSAQTMCPAPGQGALGIECRANDDATRAVVAALDHAPTRFAVTAERAALATLEGGCHVPIGVYCGPVSDAWRIIGLVARPDGSEVLREHLDFDSNAEEAGHSVALRLLERGAADFLAIATGKTPS
ncbi:MAG: hydroxymethylbilane synthase [Acidobacteriaceae bacterium]